MNLKMYENDVLRQEGLILKRGDNEVQCFANKKDAGAYLQHFYGVRFREVEKVGLHFQHFGDRGPKTGDGFVTNNYYACDKKDGEKIDTYGVIGSIAGHLCACFKPRTFRKQAFCDPSGGPLPWVDLEHMVLYGLREVYYWTWWDGSGGANQGGHFSAIMPLWRWDGTEPKKFND